MNTPPLPRDVAVPCRFCGGTQYAMIQEERAPFSFEPHRNHVVICWACGARGPVGTTPLHALQLWKAPANSNGHWLLGDKWNRGYGKEVAGPPIRQHICATCAATAKRMNVFPEVEMNFRRFVFTPATAFFAWAEWYDFTNRYLHRV